MAYADALDLLLAARLVRCDRGHMVLHELTRNQTLTSKRIATWANKNGATVIPTKIHRHYMRASAASASARKSNLGELAIQEAMSDLGLVAERTSVFLFEDHKIARASFLLPDNCRKVSTRAFLLFLEQQGLLESAADIERRAVLAGRHFSRIRFPPE